MVFLPEAADNLIMGSVAMFNYPSTEKDNLIRSLDLCLRGSRKKRRIRSLIAGTLDPIVVIQIVANDADICIWDERD